MGRGWRKSRKRIFRVTATDLDTEAFTDACKAIYRAIVNNGTWGVSALSRVSGMDFDAMSEAERRRINALPAMIYHGVRTEEAVLMRMNSAPRSAAEALGSLYRQSTGDDVSRYSVGKARILPEGYDPQRLESSAPGRCRAEWCRISENLGSLIRRRGLTMPKFSESHVEDAALDWLNGLGYDVLHGPDISPDGPSPERAAYDDVILLGRLTGGSRSGLTRTCLVKPWMRSSASSVASRNTLTH